MGFKQKKKTNRKRKKIIYLHLIASDTINPIKIKCSFSFVWRWEMLKSSVNWRDIKKLNVRKFHLTYLSNGFYGLNDCGYPGRVWA